MWFELHGNYGLVAGASIVNSIVATARQCNLDKDIDELLGSIFCTRRPTAPPADKDRPKSVNPQR